jgi:hypothetical protein
MRIAGFLPLAALAAALLASGAALATNQYDFDLDWDDDEDLVVELEDERTFDEAVLVAPDGTEIAAYRIERDRESSTSRYDDSPSAGVGVGGGSGGFGVGVGIGIPLGGGSESYVRYETEAKIRLPDMAAYRADWPKWRLRIHLPKDEDGAPARTIEMAAPPPPD